MGGKYGRENDGEGSSRAWQRDDKGRKYREEAGARRYENAEDRDSALEERYRVRACGPECCSSMLASVSAHADELVPEYMAWCQSRNVHEVFDSETLAEWEVERFGDRLYRAAHGVLLYAVKEARFGPAIRKLEKDASSSKVDMDHPEDALHRMPRRGLSRREWENRQNDAKMRAAGDDWRTDK